MEAQKYDCSLSISSEIHSFYFYMYINTETFFPLIEIDGYKHIQQTVTGYIRTQYKLTHLPLDKLPPFRRR